MKITPVDVAHKTFNRSFYGLDQKEVFSYLQDISHQLETLFKERNDLREKIRDKEIQISEYKERDQLLKNTLTTASQMSEKIREEAEKKAALILQEAQLRADEIQKSTHASLYKTYTEINNLKALRIQFETNMKALAHAHLSLLEEGKKYMGLPISMSEMSADGVVMTSPLASADSSSEAEAAKLTSEISPLAVDIL